LGLYPALSVADFVPEVVGQLSTVYFIYILYIIDWLKKVVDKPIKHEM
jgi:hypothetical protein